MKNSNLVKIPEQNQLAFFTDEQKDLLKATVNRSLTDDEFKVFMMVCERKRMDPFQKQIYAVKRRPRRDQAPAMTIQTGIDGFRALAARTGRYAGNDDTVFDQEENPRKATATVWGIVAGQRVAFTASARWDEYYPGEKLGFMWRKMPHVMLGKVAEALALRKFAPEDLSGLYISEEMDQAGPVLEARNVDEPELLEDELEEGYQRNMDVGEAVEGLAYDIKKIAVTAKLVGPNSKFGKDIKAAKAWVKEIADADMANLNEKQCQAVEDALSREDIDEALPPLPEEAKGEQGAT